MDALRGARGQVQLLADLTELLHRLVARQLVAQVPYLSDFLLVELVAVSFELLQVGDLATHLLLHVVVVSVLGVGLWG